MTLTTQDRVTATELGRVHRLLGDAAPRSGSVGYYARQIREVFTGWISVDRFTDTNRAELWRLFANATNDKPAPSKPEWETVTLPIDRVVPGMYNKHGWEIAEVTRRRCQTDGVLYRTTYGIRFKDTESSIDGLSGNAQYPIRFRPGGVIHWRPDGT